MTVRVLRGLIAGMAAAGLSAAPERAGAAASQDQAVVAVETARFVPVDPRRPEGPAIAVLRGDPDSGPSDMLLRMGRGSGRLHVHSFDYRLVVIEGEMKHWGLGESEADAPRLGPGSYWFQPGGEPHADSCLSERCLMFISWAGPRDARLHDPE